jgi:hypothetical protein
LYAIATIVADALADDPRRCRTAILAWCGPVVGISI